MFDRVLKALASDSLRSHVVLTALGVALLATWTSWMFFGRLPTYSVSSQARLEVVPAPFPVQASVRGRVVNIHVNIDDRVDAGALLIELDSAVEQAELAAAQAKLEAVKVELGA